MSGVSQEPHPELPSELGIARVLAKPRVRLGSRHIRAVVGCLLLAKHSTSVSALNCHGSLATGESGTSLVSALCPVDTEVP